MGYFRELPDIAYQSPLNHKNSSTDFIVIKNIFRKAKMFDFVRSGAIDINKYVIGDGDRPDTVAEFLYGDPTLDYIVVLVAGIVNINHEWPLQDYQVYNYALQKYKSEENLNAVKFHKTFEILDSNGRQLLPPNLIVDSDFKFPGSITQSGSDRYTLVSQAGNRQLDDKEEYTVATDGIARAVTNLEYEFSENEKKREIDVLRNGYVQTFINDLRDVVRYTRSSSFISSRLAMTENTESLNP